MPAKLLEGVSGKLAEQWVATLLTPAFVFWAGGLLAYGDRHGFTPILQWLKPYSEPIQLGIVAIALCTIAASAFVAQRFDNLVLRGLEGYWYPGLRRYPFHCCTGKSAAAVVCSQPSNASIPNSTTTAPQHLNGQNF